jgi:hypothetical protein
MNFPQCAVCRILWLAAGSASSAFSADQQLAKDANNYHCMDTDWIMS